MFCNQCEQTAQQAADDPKTDDLFRPPDIRIASGVRPTEQRRNVLQADNNTGNERTVSQLVMDISRQHGKRQADGEIADTGENDDRDNAQIKLSITD